MKTVKKKELQQSVQTALSQVVDSLEIAKPSKKTTRFIEKASKKISKELKDELKKQLKKMVKAGSQKVTNKKKEASA